VEAYADDPENTAYLRRSARLHGHIAARLEAALTEQGARCPRPAGAFYLYPDFTPWRKALAARGVQTSMDLARHLLDDWGIATLPGSEFGDKPAALRLRLATSMLCEPDQPIRAEAREAALWELLRAADALPADGAASTPLPLPALDRAIARFGEFAAALGTPTAG
jgi:aspartate/methionine/tyrosine aminotransferase